MRETDRRLWFVVALLLLLVADPLTTIRGISLVGPAVESNPIMRWLVARGTLVLIAVHVTVAGLALAGFEAVIRVGHRLSDPRGRRYELLMNVWIGGLVVLGTLVVSTNAIVLILAS